MYIKKCSSVCTVSGHDCSSPEDDKKHFAFVIENFSKIGQEMTSV